MLKEYKHRCGNCTRKINTGDKWTCDHRLALVLGGDNRELNLWPLCSWCEPRKTAIDLRLKSLTARIQRKHYGIKIPKGRPLPGTFRSGWRHRMDGAWERR